jgi:hypothetical protein
MREGGHSRCGAGWRREAKRGGIWHRRGVGERADRRGPCISKGRERRHRGWKAGIKEEMHSTEYAKGARGLCGLTKGMVTCGRGGLAKAGSQEGIQRKNIYLNFKDLKFWQDLRTATEM